MPFEMRTFAFHQVQLRLLHQCTNRATVTNIRMMKTNLRPIPFFSALWQVVSPDMAITIPFLHVCPLSNSLLIIGGELVYPFLTPPLTNSQSKSPPGTPAGPPAPPGRPRWPAACP